MRLMISSTKRVILPLDLNFSLLVIIDVGGIHQRSELPFLLMEGLSILFYRAMPHLIMELFGLKEKRRRLYK